MCCLWKKVRSLAVTVGNNGKSRHGSSHLCASRGDALGIVVVLAN
jgi:hypothetical protein